MPTHMPRRRLLAALGSIPLASLPSLAWSQAVHSAPTLGSTPPTTASSTPSAIYSEANIAHAQRLRDAGLKSALAYTLVESLTTEVGARPAGSANDARAVAWAQAAMRQLGLFNVRAEPVPLSVWQRGPLNAQLLAPHAGVMEAAMAVQFWPELLGRWRLPGAARRRGSGHTLYRHRPRPPGPHGRFAL